MKRRLPALFVVRPPVEPGRQAPANPASPLAGMPTDAYLGARRDFYFNGEAIQIVHAPAASGDGDRRAEGGVGGGGAKVEQRVEHQRAPAAPVSHVAAAPAAVALAAQHRIDPGRHVAVPARHRLSRSAVIAPPHTAQKLATRRDRQRGHWRRRGRKRSAAIATTATTAEIRKALCHRSATA